MAERPLDRLLPTALALVAGVTAFAWVLAAIVVDFSFGRPSSSSVFGIVVMLPLAMVAAMVGFAAGHLIGVQLRKRNATPAVPMATFRMVMAFVLGVATVIGATAGAMPVLRHERMQRPRVIAGEGRMEPRAGRPDNCSPLTKADVACDLQTRQRSHSMAWNGRDVTLGCTREGLITVSDAANGIVASADLTPFEYVTRVHAAAVRQDDGREGLALLAQLRAGGRREMFMVFDADGRVTYQEMLQRSTRPGDAPLSVCAAGDRDNRAR
jgi:hypothetical protein